MCLPTFFGVAFSNIVLHGSRGFIDLVLKKFSLYSKLLSYFLHKNVIKIYKNSLKNCALINSFFLRFEMRKSIMKPIAYRHHPPKRSFFFAATQYQAIASSSGRIPSNLATCNKVGKCRRFFRNLHKSK